MPVATLGDAPQFEVGLISFRVLATPSRGTSEFTSWRAALAPGGRSGVHSLDHEQLMIVSEGLLTLTVGADVAIGSPGDVLILPAGRDLEVHNETNKIAAATVVSPVGFTATAGGRTFSPPWSL